MSNWPRHYMVSIPLLFGLFFNLIQPAGTLAGRQEVTNPSVQDQEVLSTSSQLTSAPEVSYSLKNDLSPALQDLPALPPPADILEKQRELPLYNLPNREGMAPKGAEPAVPDGVLQEIPGIMDMPITEFNFEGLNNNDNANTVGFFLAPPDTQGAVGPNHYVQWVNLVFAIWQIDRSSNTASLVFGPAAGNSLWQGFGGPCEFTNDGDIVVLYDELAGRWLLSQFALFASDGFHQCVAVSQTDDPTGAWYRYDFLVSADKLNDYPKLGVWPDAYYMTANQFADFGNSWGGQGVWAFDREQMLLGLPTRMVYFDMFNVDPNLGSMLPSDLDGPPPPVGDSELLCPI